MVFEALHVVAPKVAGANVPVCAELGEFEVEAVKGRGEEDGAVAKAEILGLFALFLEG